MNAREYWERKILSWEEARYSSKARFYPPAWPLRSRLTTAANVIASRGGPGWTVLDLGCGSGLLGAKLRGRVREYTGVDLASSAIDTARKNLPEFWFITGDVLTLDLPKADLTVLLGLTDWIPDGQLHKLFERIPSKHILFSYTRASTFNPYRIYRWVMDRETKNSGNKGRTYSREFIQKLLVQTGWRGEELKSSTLFNPGVLIWASKVSL